MSYKRLGMFVVALCAMWIVPISYVAVRALPFSPLVLPGAQSMPVGEVFPEAWRFFTRDPQEPRTRYFAPREGAWRDVSLGPHARASNFFGLSRLSHRQNIEGALILHVSKVVEASLCEDTVEACIGKAPISEAHNPSPHPTLCGDIAIVRQRIPPWAWARRGDVRMPYSITRLKISC
jgi:antimicrobial peptide system SdpA family protein